MATENIPESEKTKEAHKEEGTTEAQKKAEKKVKKHVESEKLDPARKNVDTTPTSNPEKER